MRSSWDEWDISSTDAEAADATREDRADDFRCLGCETPILRGRFCYDCRVEGDDDE